MRVPEVDVQKPVVVLAVVADPFERDGRDLVGALEPASAGVVDLVEVGVPVPGGMAFAEGGDGDGFDSEIAQAAHPARTAERRCEFSIAAFGERIGCGAAV